MRWRKGSAISTATVIFCRRKPVRLLLPPADTHSQPVYSGLWDRGRCDTRSWDLPIGLPGIGEGARSADRALAPHPRDPVKRPGLPPSGPPGTGSGMVHKA